MKIILLTCLLGFSTSLYAQGDVAHRETYTLHTKELIKPYQASYTIRKFGMKAVINTSVKTENGRFTYTKHTKPKGLAKMVLKEATETSVFSVTETGLKVHEYELITVGKDASRNESFALDEYTQQISGISRGTAFNLPAQENLIDRASMEIMLMLDAGKRSDLEYKVVDGQWVKDYKFEYLGQQNVKTAGSSYTCDVYKVVRSSGKRSTSLCLAELLGFLPVMVTHEDDGNEFKAMMSSQNLLGK